MLTWDSRVRGFAGCKGLSPCPPPSSALAPEAHCTAAGLCLVPLVII